MAKLLNQVTSKSFQVSHKVITYFNLL